MGTPAGSGKSLENYNKKSIVNNYLDLSFYFSRPNFRALGANEKGDSSPQADPYFSRNSKIILDKKVD
jgi:hypothetical protein